MVLRVGKGPPRGWGLARPYLLRWMGVKSMSAPQQLPKPCVYQLPGFGLYCRLFLNAVLARAYWKDQKFEFLKPLKIPCAQGVSNERGAGGSDHTGRGAGGGGFGEKPVETCQEEAVADGLSGQAAHLASGEAAGQLTKHKAVISVCNLEGNFQNGAHHCYSETALAQPTYTGDPGSQHSRPQKHTPGAEPTETPPGAGRPRLGSLRGDAPLQVAAGREASSLECVQASAPT